jgi:hypothetical protein
MEIVGRTTKDVDFLDDDIPKDIEVASKQFAKMKKLSPDWLNARPAELKFHLPDNWRQNVQKIFEGKSIVFWTLSRIDLLRTKIWSLCDRQRDFDDVLAMKPTEGELALVEKWLGPLDRNPAWPEYVAQIIRSLSKELGYAG